MVLWVPRVYETIGSTEREYDLFSRLLSDRIIILGTDVDDRTANLIVAQMLFLQSENKNQDISLYINSQGGDITAGLAIYDTMQFVLCDVATYCIGSASSMAAVLLAAGTAGKRFALPHAQIMIHQPWGVFRGTAADLSIQAEEILENGRRLNGILARHTGRDIAQVEKDTDRDCYLSAADARDYGIVDEVIESMKKS
jgi:ATP-dependent Clp protease protease subunit